MRAMVESLRYRLNSTLVMNSPLFVFHVLSQLSLYSEVPFISGPFSLVRGPFSLVHGPFPLQSNWPLGSSQFRKALHHSRPLRLLSRTAA